MKDILADAQKNKYAVELFNTIDADMYVAGEKAIKECSGYHHTKSSKGFD